MRFQRVGFEAALLARLGVAGLNQVNQCLPRQHLFNLRQELHPPVAPPRSASGLGRGVLLNYQLLIIREVKLLAGRQLNTER